MFIVTHAALGVMIAEVMPAHPVAAFVLAFVAHFLTDIIPHGDTHLYNGYIAGTHVKRALIFVIIDSVATAALLLCLCLIDGFDPLHRSTLLAGALGGIVPDAIVAVYLLFHVKALRWFHRLHFFFHNLINSRMGDLSLESGTVLEFLLLTMILYRVT